MSHGDRHARYARLIAAAREFPPLKVAVAHPCDAAALGAALEAAELGLIEPILVGPRARIEAAAAQVNGADLSRFRIVESAAQPRSGGQGGGAGARRRGRGADEGQPAHRRTDGRGGRAAKTGLRTARRISHCFVMDVPDHPSR